MKTMNNQQWGSMAAIFSIALIAGIVLIQVSNRTATEYHYHTHSNDTEEWEIFIYATNNVAQNIFAMLDEISITYDENGTQRTYRTNTNTDMTVAFEYQHSDSFCLTQHIEITKGFNITILWFYFRWNERILNPPRPIGDSLILHTDLDNWDIYWLRQWFTWNESSTGWLSDELEI